MCVVKRGASERQTDRDREGQRETETDRQIETERDTDTERERCVGGGEGGELVGALSPVNRDRDRQTATERDGDREKERCVCVCVCVCVRVAGELGWGVQRERKYSLALTHWGNLPVRRVVMLTQNVIPFSVGARNLHTVFAFHVIRLVGPPVKVGRLLVVAVQHPFTFSHQIIQSIPDIVYS